MKLKYGSEDKLKNILFIAPPAGGKGTLSKKLSEKYGYVHISSGDLLRSVAETDKLYEEIRACMSQGKLVDDEIIFELLETKLKSAKNFILDGFPRNIEQAKKLDVALEELNIPLDLVIYIDVPFDICQKRILGRLNCPQCGTIYNKFFKNTVEDGICDNCGSPLEARLDDNEEAFKKRYDTFLTDTVPLKEYYQKCGKLVVIDGKDDPFESVVSVINDD